MLSKISRVIILVLSIFLITFTNSLAFHKNNSPVLSKTDWTGKKETKKEFEILEKRLSCAYSAKAGVIKGEPKFDEKTGEDLLDENGKKIFEDDQYVIEIEGWHDENPLKADGKIHPRLFNLNFNFNYETIKLVDLLLTFCIQDKTKPRPSKFKGSYLEELYTEIAFDNGYVKPNKEGKLSGDFNLKVKSNPLLEDMLGPGGTGFIIKNPNVVWYLPDYLIPEYNEKEKLRKEKEKKEKIEAEKKKKKDEERKRKKAIKDAEIKANDDWISENKENLLQEFKVLLSVFEKNINDLENERKKIFELFNEYKSLIETADEAIDIAFDDLINIQDEQIKSKKTEIRENKKIYLSNITFEDLEKKTNYIGKFNFSKYKNYKKLKSIISKAEKVNSAADFVGKDKITFIVPLIGKEFSIGSSKIGFIEQFEDIKNQSLGSDYTVHQKNLKELRNDLQSNINNIQQLILEPVDQIKVLDEELGNRIPWGKYFIYLIIFITVVSAIGFLIFQQRKMKALQEESEKKVGSLKSDFEGKLRSAAEQMRYAKSQPVQNTENIEQNIKPQVQETPKTPEQIIAEKYDELISEYNDALNDFSKVAAFKQKWSGLALSRKERQDGTKTILISSSRAFEKSEIWCVTFSDKFFGLPGSSVKSNMATYMNLDFEKANRDFKGVFSIATGTTYSVEPCVLRKGGAGFVVERSGKIIFPS